MPVLSRVAFGLVTLLGVVLLAPTAHAAWIDQGTTTNTVVVPDTAVPDTVTSTYSVLVPSTRTDIRYREEASSWVEVPVGTGGGKGAATSRSFGVYQSSRTTSKNGANVDSQAGRAMLGVGTVRSSKPASAPGLNQGSSVNN